MFDQKFYILNFKHGEILMFEHHQGEKGEGEVLRGHRGVRFEEP